MEKPFIIHPFLFAIFPILFLFAHNIEQVSVSETLLPSAIVLGFTFLMILLLGLILKDNKKAGIITSAFLALFFSYGYAATVIDGWQIGNFLIGRQRYLMFIWVALFVCGSYFIIRKIRGDLHSATKILNIVSFFLIALSLINIGVYQVKARGVWQYDEHNNIDTEERAINTTDSGEASALRDIYYIILDGYDSSSTLKEIYDYDNQEFTDYLTERGFYIASKSSSNYAMTFLSLASSLNMRYINDLRDVVGGESKDRALPYQMIKNSEVMNFLKSKGYMFIHFGSGWGATDRNGYADLDIRCGKVNEFLMVLIQRTMLNPFIGEYLIRHDKRERVLCTFSKLAELHSIEGPKFVFAHILIPHSIYVFGANGEWVPKAELKMSGGPWKQKQNYINQILFANKKVKILFDEILAQSKTSPIIILQADHGSATTFGDSESDIGGWENPTDANFKERMRIFNAYHLPADGSVLLFDSITPVNTFRLIFDFYFNTSYGLLDDQSYYSTYEHPYKFLDISEKIRYTH